MNRNDAVCLHPRRSSKSHATPASRLGSFPLVCPSVARPVAAQQEEERKEKLPVAAAKRLGVK